MARNHCTSCGRHGHNVNRCPERGDGAAPVADAVMAALTARGISEHVRAGRVITEWTELVGQKVAKFSMPTDITEKRGKRTLWIDVASSAWLNELTLLRARLVKRLNDVLGAGEPVFDELRLRLAGGHRVTSVVLRAAPASKPPARCPPPAATGDSRDRIVREVAAVDDAELRELIARVRIAHDR